MAAIRPKADIKLILAKWSANDPKRNLWQAPNILSLSFNSRSILMSSRFKLHAKTAESVSDAGVVVGCHKRTQCRFSLPNARMLSPRVLRTQPYFFGFVQVFLMVLLGAGCDRMKSNHAEIPEELNGASFAA